MDEQDERADIDRTALEIAELLPAVASTLRVGALFDAAGSDLTANQLVTLLLIGNAPDARMRAGDIARRMSISAASATALVDRLVEADMLARSRGDDRRIVWISLTDSGHDLIRQLKAGTVARIAAALSSTPAATRAELVNSLRQVTAFAQDFTEASLTGP